MKVIGIGTDIMKVDRIAHLEGKWEDAFFRKVYTPTEREQGRLRGNPLLYFATRFCGKEAVFKTLHMDSNHARLNEIEITSRENGEPEVTLHGKISEQASKLGITQIQLSLSYDTDYAIAYAIALKN